MHTANWIQPRFNGNYRNRKTQAKHTSFLYYVCAFPYSLDAVIPNFPPASAPAGASCSLLRDSKCECHSTFRLNYYKFTRWFSFNWNESSKLIEHDANSWNASMPCTTRGNRATNGSQWNSHSHRREGLLVCADMYSGTYHNKDAKCWHLNGIKHLCNRTFWSIHTHTWTIHMNEIPTNSQNSGALRLEFSAT